MIGKRNNLPPSVRSIVPLMHVKASLAGLLSAAMLWGSVDLVVAAEDGWEPVVAKPSATAPTPPTEATPAVPTGWETTVAPPVAAKSAPKALPADRVPAADAAAKTAAPAPQEPKMPQPLTPTVGQVAAVEPAPTAIEPLVPEANLARQYCVNIADAAADARFAWQKKTLAEIEQELNKRIATLEERTAEYKKWLARRDDFSQKAQESVIRIYSRMRPEAAASQLAALDEETAAAVLIKLDPRNASVIMNEMEPAKAARLTGTISGAAKHPPARNAKAAQPAPQAAPDAATKPSDGKKS